MTSAWSPKIDRAWVARVRAATCITNGVSSPAILYMSGIISSSPCDAVNVVAERSRRERAVEGARGPGLGLHLDDGGTSPHTFALPFADHSSASSPIVELGVIG